MTRNLQDIHFLYLVLLQSAAMACNSTTDCESCRRGTYRGGNVGGCRPCFHPDAVFGLKHANECPVVVGLEVLVIAIGLCFCVSYGCEWYAARHPTVLLPPQWREEGRKDHMYQGKERGSPRLWVTTEDEQDAPLPERVGPAWGAVEL